MIGYNIAEAKKVIEQVVEAHNSFGNTLERKWDILVSILHKEWKGVDEQDFEKTLAVRIRKLFETTYELSKTTVDNLVNLANAWIDFQKKNTISGEDAYGSVFLKRIEPIGNLKKDVFVHFEPIFYDEDQNLGLKDSNSGTTIISEIDYFADSLISWSETYFEKIKPGKAFLGEQATSIEGYLSSVGTAIGEITVAVNDLKKAVATLARTSYNQSVSSVSSQMSEAKASVSDTSSLEDMKWSTGE